jgi:SAM-dependent methyltransferase
LEKKVDITDSCTEENLYWEQRSKKYGDLKWVHNNTYIEDVLKSAQLDKSHLVLEVGSGTGSVSKEIKPLVSKVIGMDISSKMIKSTSDLGISSVLWDITKPLFKSNLFDRIIARMVFHHVISDIDQAMSLCLEYLKPGGIMVIAEAVPPSNSEEVVNWFSTMMSHKEERINFTDIKIKNLFCRSGFINIDSYDGYMDNFDLNNWIENAIINSSTKKTILDMHINAPDSVKAAHQMRIRDDGKITIRSKYSVVVAQKSK